MIRPLENMDTGGNRRTVQSTTNTLLKTLQANTYLNEHFIYLSMCELLSVTAKQINKPIHNDIPLQQETPHLFINSIELHRSHILQHYKEEGVML